MANSGSDSSSSGTTPAPSIKKKPTLPDFSNSPSPSFEPSGPTGNDTGITAASPASGFTPPAVPKYTGGHGKTVVNTDALEAFGNNIAQLVQPVAAVANLLNVNEPVTAGGFYQAYELNSVLTGNPATDAVDDGASHLPGGASSAKSVVNIYYNVLSNLGQGLTDLHAAVKQMSSTYKTADDLSKASVADLQTTLGSVQNDFTALMQANGGSAPPSSLAPPSPPSTSTTGTGGSGTGGSG